MNTWPLQTASAAVTVFENVSNRRSFSMSSSVVLRSMLGSIEFDRGHDLHANFPYSGLSPGSRTQTPSSEGVNFMSV